MTALEKGLQWERALDLFDEMKLKRLAVTVRVFLCVHTLLADWHQFVLLIFYLLFNNNRL